MSEWHETWVEEFTTSGAVKRSADKWGCKAPGSIPEDGHANRWQERWGEDWDGNGNVTKWTDKWAERDQAEGGGPPRAWGDKWEERNSSATGTGSKNVRIEDFPRYPRITPRETGSHRLYTNARMRVTMNTSFPRHLRTRRSE